MATDSYKWIEGLKGDNFFGNIDVHCDRTDDVNLFNNIKHLSPLTGEISSHNVYKYPRAGSKKAKSKFGYIHDLFRYDRPDYIVTFNKVPVCAVEVTEHAYTGDNGLQRFTRAASAGEQEVPFIYFGPASRVRDDELEEVDDPESLSKRSLTSDFYKGMAELHKNFGSYQLFSEWETGTVGKVKKPPPNAGREELSEIYGDLMGLIESVLVINTPSFHPPDILSKSSYHVNTRQDDLIDLSNKTNTRGSDVKVNLDESQTRKILKDPSKFLEYLSKEYFYKGKGEKLFALHAINNFSYNKVLLRDKVLSDKPKVSNIKNKIRGSEIFDGGSIVYYTGYKWRSDPHCGVASNIYHRLCKRSDDTDLPLLLYYPRISIGKTESNRLMSNSLVNDLKEEFRNRYPQEYEEKFEKKTISNNLYAQWNTGVKQDRIFRHYCTIIFCNDGIVIGEKAAEIFDDE
ncbi:hypothetical protein [Salinibacter ruber]|uniref:hypothetical protein n=1 Tax=Salinibacter ruber TaxID=146919 RepID=UPI0020743AEC|nr:hypothetical protein [Salinibacter ruber]